jgi:glycosyltransferase involved in cell wall biosynthesis
LTTAHRALDPRIFCKQCVGLSEAGNRVVLVAPGDADGELGNVRLVTVKREMRKLRRMTWGVFRVLRAALREDADLYHFHDPELIPVGLLMRALGKRVIYDVHEDLPADVLGKDWIPRSLRALVSCAAGAVEATSACCFDGIVAATPHIARRFPRHKTVLVQNFPVLKTVVAEQQRPYQERPSTVAYVGVAARSRGICEVVSAMSLLPERLGARLRLIGEIRPTALETHLRGTPGWRCVDSLGLRGQGAVSRLVSEARVGIVTFLPAPNALRSQPTKLFEYMEAGLPVVASDFPHWRGIVQGNGCGLLVDPAAPRAIARAIEWLLVHPEEAEQMGRRGRAAVADRFNWQKEFLQLLELYNRLLHGTDQRGGGAPPVHQGGDPQRSASRAA